MVEQTKNVYEVLYYDGWGSTPAYYLIDFAKGETLEEALKDNLSSVTSKVRRLFWLPKGDPSDEKIQETIYVLQETGLTSVIDLERQSREC